MCGRMIVEIDGVAYFYQFSSQENGWEYDLAPERFQRMARDRSAREVRPTDEVILHRVVGRELIPEPAFWTLVPPWIDAPSSVKATPGGPRLVPPPQTHFNSRRDTLLKSSGWRKLLASQRGVVMANAFLEWSDVDMLAGAPKQVGRYALTGSRVMPLACIWNQVQAGSETILTCSVITVPPNPLLESLPHHRMPAILMGRALWEWLDPRTSDPERCLQTTLGAEFESTVLPASRYDDLVPEARARARTSSRTSRKQADLPASKPILPDLFG